MDKKILVTRSSMPSLDEYVDEIRPIWDSNISYEMSKGRIK